MRHKYLNETSLVTHFMKNAVLTGLISLVVAAPIIACHMTTFQNYMPLSHDKHSSILSELPMAKIDPSEALVEEETESPEAGSSAETPRSTEQKTKSKDTNAVEMTPLTKPESPIEDLSFVKLLKKPQVAQCKVTKAIPAKVIQPQTYSELRKILANHDYKLHAAAKKHVAVPHLHLKALPNDFGKNTTIQDKKQTFMKSLLPLIIAANQEIEQERIKLLQIADLQKKKKALSVEHKKFLDFLKEKYRMKSISVKELIKKVDIIPPSLALAQAIEESGWGTSFAARKKNSTFGITLSSGVKHYDSLEDSVKGYIRNLNANPAYKTMREARAEMRNKGMDLNSIHLIQCLDKYSELRGTYISKVKTIINKNQLKRFDSAQLHPV